MTAASAGLVGGTADPASRACPAARCDALCCGVDAEVTQRGQGRVQPCCTPLPERGVVFPWAVVFCICGGPPSQRGSSPHDGSPRRDPAAGPAPGRSARFIRYHDRRGSEDGRRSPLPRSPPPPARPAICPSTDGPQASACPTRRASRRPCVPPAATYHNARNRARRVPRGRPVGHPWPRIGASRVAYAFLVCMPSPLPRCSGWGVLVTQYHPSVSAFPSPTAVSACTLSFSGLAQRSHTLRPTHSRGRLYVAAIRRLQTLRHLHACSGCFRLERVPGGACTRWRNAAFSRPTWIADVPEASPLERLLPAQMLAGLRNAVTLFDTSERRYHEPGPREGEEKAFGFTTDVMRRQALRVRPGQLIFVGRV